MDESEKAEMEWVKCAQKGVQENSDYKKHKDQLGIVVHRGRFAFPVLELSAKNPIIL